MTTNITELKNRVSDGGCITESEALELYDSPLEELCDAANEIRKHFCKNDFDICAIINGKSGKCSENCKYCAQSSYYSACPEEYPLLDTDTVIKQARYNAENGILRYSIVTSGRRLSDFETDQMCDTIRKLKKSVNISVCVSFGLLDEKQFAKLKDAGVSRVHNNIETSERNFPNI